MSYGERDGWIYWRELTKSVYVKCVLSFSIADQQASLIKDVKSAPLKFSVCLEIWSKFNSLFGLLWSIVDKIYILSSSVGSPMKIWIPNHSFLIIAGSMMSGLFVDAIKYSSSSLFEPISESNWFTTLSWCEDSLPILHGHIESNSSKNIIHGWFCLALLKISQIFFSVSPRYLLRSSGPLMTIKLLLLS